MNHPFTLHRMCAKGHQLATALYSLARLELNGLVSTWQDPTSYGAGFDKNVSEVCPPPQQVVWNSGILRLLQILNMIHSDRWLYRAVLLHGFDIFWSWSMILTPMVTRSIKIWWKPCIVKCNADRKHWDLVQLQLWKLCQKPWPRIWEPNCKLMLVRIDLQILRLLHSPTRDRKGIERVVYCTSLQFPRISSISNHIHSNDCQIGWDRGGWTIFGYIGYITNCCCAECYCHDPTVIEPSKLLVWYI